MFLKLTFYDGTPFRIRPELITNYGSADTNGANSYVSDVSTAYHVKETVEEIDRMFEPITMHELTEKQIEKLKQDWKGNWK